MPPPLGGSSGGLPTRVEYLSPQGVLLPLVYGTTASPLWFELRGHSAWQVTPSWTVYRLACHRLLPWLRVTFAMVLDAAWPGSDQWLWSTAPATGPVGRLGRPSASDPWGIGSFLSLGCPTCVQRPGPLGSCSPVCPRGLLWCVCGVLGQLAPVHRSARSVCCVVPNMESTLEKIAFCHYKTKMDKRSGFWQVDLTPNAQELLAFITPQGRVFKWKVMPFGVANAPALFQELMNKILSILRGRPKVQELISRGAQMEAHIDDVCLGTNTQEDHLILSGEFFAVCQGNHTRLKLGYDGKTPRKDFMMYAVSFGRATSIAAISKTSPTPAPF